MIQVNNFRLFICLLLLLFALPGVAVQSDKLIVTEQASSMPVEQQTTQDQATKRPRLKYRSGPVCMCSQGMSEADILAAKKKNASQ